MRSNAAGVRVVRFALIVLAGALFSILLHQFHHDPLMTLATKPRSVVVTAGYFAPVAFGSLVGAFGLIGAVFLALQKGLRGSGTTKGVLYGLALGGMYFVGMIEAYVVYPVPLFGELYTGMADAVGILLMSILLGKYLADGAASEGRDRGALFPAVLLIPISYVLVRYFAYTMLSIESSYATRPLATFLWTAAMGGWISTMYLMVGGSARPGGSLRHALTFGWMVFGANWLVFNLFALLFIEVSALDLLYRSLLDAVAITLGVYLSSRCTRERQMPPPAT